MSTQTDRSRALVREAGEELQRSTAQVEDVGVADMLNEEPAEICCRNQICFMPVKLRYMIG